MSNLVNKTIFSMSNSLTKNMLVDIDAIPEGENAAMEIDFLRRIDSWSMCDVDFVERPKLFRYMVALYSHDSFLNKRNQISLNDRKLQALHFAGIEMSGDIESNLLNLENDIVLLMVQDFLIAQNNNLWTEIVTTEQQYEEAVRLRLQPIDKKAKDKDQLDAAAKKKALRNDCKEMVAEIDRLYGKFYADHDDARDRVRVRATSLEQLAKSALHV